MSSTTFAMLIVQHIMKKMVLRHRSKKILPNFSQTYDLNSPLQMEQRNTSCCTKQSGKKKEGYKEEVVILNEGNCDDNETTRSAQIDLTHTAAAISLTFRVGVNSHTNAGESPPF